MMEPYISILGYIVYGLFYSLNRLEVLDIFKRFAPTNWCLDSNDYYSGQGNAMRVFEEKHFSSKLSDWKIIEVKKIAALTYIASGGYSGPQLYPMSAYPFIKTLENILQPFPALFATRLLVVLEKIN